MEQSELILGKVTYQISRIYNGSRPAVELVAEQMVKRLSENPPFDERHTKAV